MIKKRILTAVIMAAVFVCALFFFSWFVFSLMMAAVLIVAAWEWSSLAGIGERLKRFVYVAVVIAVSLFAAWITNWTRNPEYLEIVLMLACSWWALALLWVQGFPSSGLIWGGRLTRAAMGIGVLTPAWLSLVALRGESNGALLVLLVVLLVAAADIGAYFSGRAFGRIKLAPKVSPGKSWEGVVGGILSALLLGVVFNLVLGGDQWQSLFLIVIPTALVSVLGDLLESMVKRHRGVKDSGSILPGHGGVLDRVDGLTAALPVFTFALLLTSWRI